MQWSLSLLAARPCWFKPSEVINGPGKKLLTQIDAKKRHGKDARMFFSLIYFFAPFSIFYIPHNYVILQTMPHAIAQTRSAFYPHRTWYTLISRNWKELATMSCNIIIITILKIFPTKKLKSKCLMYVVMCMLSKVNLKKENISADLVIWIINKQCLEIPLTG